MDGSTRLTVKHRQIFMSAIDAATAHPPVFRVARSLDAIIRSSLVYVVPLTVFTAWSSLADHLCLAVLVEIIYKELRIMGTCTDIIAQIYAPEFRAIQFVAVDIHASRVSAADGVVLRSGGIPLHENLILSIAIHIAHAAVVGGISICLTDSRAIGFRT